ncbi:MAG: diadenylate cyclase CdaA [Firmicutes bacterium]|nr:diadenylate cyclase CdaA [Bacillota bacterium]
MNEFRELLPFLKQWSTYLDIGIIAFIIYKLMMLIKETRAEQLIKGIIVLIIITKLSDIMQLHTMYWLLKNAMTVGVIAILIIFQPELRRALEHIGRGKLFVKSELQKQEIENMLKEISTAVSELSKNKIGAIIVLEQDTGLNEYIGTGVLMDSEISAGLFINIFTPNTPLHDGAIIIRKNRIAAAGCFLPLTDNQNLSKQLGTRHRAALGITEISDSLVIIVSEETGVISFAKDGKLSRYLDPKSLKEILNNEYTSKEQVVLRKWGVKDE